MFLIHTKYDRLIKAIGSLQIFGQMSCHNFRARKQRNQPLEIFCPIQIRRYLAPETVQHARVNLQSACVHIRNDTIHTIGCKKTIVNALPAGCRCKSGRQNNCKYPCCRRALVWRSCRFGWPIQSNPISCANCPLHLPSRDDTHQR